MTSQNPSTALALPERVPALAAIFSDLLDLAANMLPEFGRGGKRRSFAERRAQIERHVIYSPTSVGMPFVSTVTFGGERKKLGWTAVPKLDENANELLTEEGHPIIDDTLHAFYDIVIKGKAELPTIEDASKREVVDVVPLVTCDGRGGYIKYVNMDGENVRAGSAMMCVFVADFDSNTDRESGRVRAIPLGLARDENIARWNSVVMRMASQDSTKGWQRIEPIPNNIGRAITYLLLRPAGPASMKGLLPCYRNRDSKPLDPDYYMVELLWGKKAILDNKSGQIILKGDEVPEQYFLIREVWNSIQLTVWGLPGEIKTMELKELDLGEVHLDALALLGVTLYDVHPGSGPKLVGSALNDPPHEHLIASGVITPDASRDTAVATIRGMAGLLRERVRAQVTEARAVIVHALGASGVESSGKPGLQDILGELTSEALACAIQKNDGDCPLASWMLERTSVQSLGLSVWDWKCWTLRESRKELLLEMARQNGLELPAPKSAGITIPQRVEPEIVAQGGDSTTSDKPKKPRAPRKSRAKPQGAAA